MYLRPETEPVPIHPVRIRRHTRLRSAKTTGTGPFPRCGTAIPWLRFGGPRSPIERWFGSPAVVADIVNGNKKVTILTVMSVTSRNGYWIDAHWLRQFYNLYSIWVWQIDASYHLVVKTGDKGDGWIGIGLGQHDISNILLTQQTVRSYHSYWGLLLKRRNYCTDNKWYSDITLASFDNEITNR